MITHHNWYKKQLNPKLTLYFHVLNQDYYIKARNPSTVYTSSNSFYTMI